MGLSSDELCFGTGWGEPARQRHYKDAFGLVVAAAAAVHVLIDRRQTRDFAP